MLGYYEAAGFSHEGPVEQAIRAEFEGIWVRSLPFFAASRF
jgi:hypothetical protein